MALSEHPDSALDIHLVKEGGRLLRAAVDEHTPGNTQAVFGAAHSDEACSPLVRDLVLPRSVVREVTGFEPQQEDRWPLKTLCAVQSSDPHTATACRRAPSRFECQLG